MVSEDTGTERNAGALAAGSAEATEELPGALRATASATAFGVNGASAAAEAARSQGGGLLVHAGPSTARAHTSASWRVWVMEGRLVGSIVSMESTRAVSSSEKGQVAGMWAG